MSKLLYKDQTISGSSNVVDFVKKNEMRPVTSNAVFNLTTDPTYPVGLVVELRADLDANDVLSGTWIEIGE